MQHPDDILKPLLNSAKLPAYVERLQRVLEEEEVKRRDFYEWLDEDKRAEFILGEVIVHSPARLSHIVVLQNLEMIIVGFVKKNSRGMVLREQALIKMKRSDFMPDLAFWRKEISDTFKGDTKQFPAPDFIIEVLSPDTEKNDRGKKKEEYAVNGVKEYWIVDPDTKFIEQYLLQGEDYYLKEKLHHGTVQCEVLQGLEIELKDFFDT
ncbi:MAG: Uma2 family endonuclease [Flavisolibacter sp.]|nr:Uma2 family endonuclease [Flavisolibacter sp.]